MTQNPIEHHVLTVGPDSKWNTSIGNILKQAGVTQETAPNADAAIDRLAQADSEAITSVITDGLRGNWLRVAAAAMEAGATVAVVVKSSLPLEGAAEMDVPVFVRPRIKDNPMEHNRLVQAVAPRPTNLLK